MASLWSKLMAGLAGFREGYMSAGSQEALAEEFGDFDARRLRYEIFWSFFENTAYRDLHTWAQSYRRTHGLYRHVRNIYNPAYRLGEFWKSHLLGGLLDPGAGDGEEIASALPILIPETNGRADPLRLAIGRVWEWSRWQVNKDILSLWGSILGDVGLRVVDDREREKVYLEVVHPGIIADVTADPLGNVKGYVIEEARPDPERPGRMVTYRETAEREGESVVYRTYRDKKPYAWNGTAAEWREPYGFVPLVMVQHNNVGLEWGWSELHPARSKIHEVDDMASALGDQIRKSVNVVWAVTGQAKPSGGLTMGGAEASTERPEPGREEAPILYFSNPQAEVKPLVAPLSISETLEHIKGILEEVERDYPELQMDIWNAAETTSGRALRTARQRVDVKVQQRRPNYDDAVRRGQQMAVAIAGFRGLKGFEGFGLESYGQGELDHHIGKRAVFGADPMDDLEIDEMFWKVAESARRAGVPLPVYLAQAGWSDDRIEEVVGSDEYQARMANEAMMLQVENG